MLLLVGPPLSQETADKMGADAYAAGPQEAVSYLNTVVVC